jgi:hypothetical protein
MGALFCKALLYEIFAKSAARTKTAWYGSRSALNTLRMLPSVRFWSGSRYSRTKVFLLKKMEMSLLKIKF